jgi:hypothetical protein
MRLSALAIAVVAVSGPTIANHVEGRAARHTWSITKFSFCRGEISYKYSFDVKGDANGNTPAFFGTCIGTNGKVYLQCTSNPSGRQDFNLFAKTEITTATKDATDGVPKVTIETEYIGNGCKYTRTGSKTVSDATCASEQGSKFKIAPKDSAVC